MFNYPRGVPRVILVFPYYNYINKLSETIMVMEFWFILLVNMFLNNYIILNNLLKYLH
ncbi:MAG: hypothetical protein K0R54_5985 [Clostridiaceae bacterium]|nr:hypothetical protein [Clostridiaceae bacterium]